MVQIAVLSSPDDYYWCSHTVKSCSSEMKGSIVANWQANLATAKMFQFETQNQTLINIFWLTTDLRWVWHCSCTLIFGSH